MTVQSYADFLAAKACISDRQGFEIDDSLINPLLKPHQRAIVRWAIAGGRRGIFAAFGLGKSIIQIEILRILLVLATANAGRALIVAPLGVRREFVKDAAMLGVPVRFVRSSAEIEAPGLYLTNYESVRDGKIDVGLFDIVSLDEASCLRGFGGTKTFREFMRIFDADNGAGRVAYRFVATATPSPNETIEILAYAAFLGVMDVGQAKTRFFKRNSEKADQLTLHPHKREEFWLWVASWALFVQKPSDLCGCSCHGARRSPDGGSANLSSSNGCPVHSETARGGANAIAVPPGSQPATTSSPEGSQVAAASFLGMGPKAQEPTPLGEQCSTASTAIAASTEGAVSKSASDGSPSPTSSLIWASPSPAKRSTESITIEATSQGTVAGQAAKSRLGTPGVTCSSASEDVSSLSQPGPRSAGSATGSFTPATKLGGASKGCSATSCVQCNALDDGYELPELRVVYHEVKADLRGRTAERDGQGILLRDAAIGLQDAAREKRETLGARVAAMRAILDADPADHAVLWHDLEDERRAIEAAVPSAVSVYGSQDLDAREQAIADFSDGRTRYLAAKPVMLGSGCNLQRHCATAVFLGIGFKFNDFIQAIHRLQRFLQTRAVTVHIIFAETEREILRTLQRKWRQHNEMVATMTEIIKRYGLSEAAMAQTLARSIGCARIEKRGDRFTLINSDCVEETSRMAADSVGLIVSSLPFSTQYEYTPSYNDFGHTDDDAHFWRQMDYLTPQLLRVLQPGRVAAIHVKDRITPGGINGFGFQTLSPFSDDAVAHFRRHGFAFLGRKTITTDVVRENNQTYRLGWTEQCKDGSRMGCGVPEYLLLFRKAPTNRSNGYADQPVRKPKREWSGDAGAWSSEGYSRARWQVDAHGYQRSGGDRLLRADELVGLEPNEVWKRWRAFSEGAVYDFEHHVAIGESLEMRGCLPPTFMLLPPHSWHPDVWSDVARMLTLNGAQAAKGREMHLCPLQFDIVDRAIAQFSELDDVVLDPFGGLMTVPVRALKAGRRGYGIELNPGYFLDGCAYVEAEANKVATPTLFDLLDRPAEVAA